MSNNYISDSEQARIIEMQKQGRSYREIGKELGRDASSVFRIVSGERGTFWKSHKTQTWRCNGCGGMIRDYKCRSCELNNTTTSAQKNRRSTKHWFEQIKTKRREKVSTVLRVINDERKKHQALGERLYNESRHHKEG